MIGSSTEFFHMAAETRQAISACIDEILAALGQEDYETFRARIASGSVLLSNLGKWSSAAAALNYEEVVALVDSRSDDDQERILRLLSGLRQYLPMIGLALIAAARIFPQPEGGRPTALKGGREAEREACKFVMRRIETGESEAEAKRYVARKLKISPRTMHRTWKRRQELLAELSFEEFLEQLLKSLSAPQPVQETNIGAQPGESGPDLTPDEIR
jgi:hypothetical protein